MFGLFGLSRKLRSLCCSDQLFPVLISQKHILNTRTKQTKRTYHRLRRPTTPKNTESRRPLGKVDDQAKEGYKRIQKDTKDTKGYKRHTKHQKPQKHTKTHKNSQKHTQNCFLVTDTSLNVSFSISIVAKYQIQNRDFSKCQFVPKMTKTS